MESFIEALRSGSILAWVGLAGFVTAVIFILRLLLKYSKWLVLLVVFMVVVFGVIKYFPELVMPFSEWFQSFFPEELPEILQESIIMN